jgi:hypothetical protein
MIYNNEILYSLDDVMIEPSGTTRVKHRSDCQTKYDDGFLPLFTAPMPCVVSLKNEQYKKYLDSGINVIIPRTETITDRINFLNADVNIFVAFSLDEFIDVFIDEKYKISDIRKNQIKVLVDVACGSMDCLHNAILQVKNKYLDNICIMGGNVASPTSFIHLAGAGCDMIRLGIGGGSGCNTTTYTGVYYPMASLIDKCMNLKFRYGIKTKIIADGGITNYRNAFKALALGADYVMMGSRLCQCRDSAGEIDHETKLYFGMASEIGSSLLGKDASAPEGMVKHYPILENISEFARLFSRYLSSTMSYCDATNLKDFIGYQRLNVISQSAQKQFNN